VEGLAAMLQFWAEASVARTTTIRPSTRIREVCMFLEEEGLRTADKRGHAVSVSKKPGALHGALHRTVSTPPRPLGYRGL
jgi:hypothetical protein